MGSKQSSTKLQQLVNDGDVLGVRNELSLCPTPSNVHRSFRTAVKSMNLQIISEFVGSKAVTDHVIRKCLLHSLAPVGVEESLWLPIQYSRRTELELTSTICYLASLVNSVDDKDRHGYTILLRACYWGITELVRYLVERTGADPHLTTKIGRTALMLAVNSGNLKLVRYLVEIKKLNVDAQATNGSTALMIAIIQRQYEIIAYLSREANADLGLKGKIIPSVVFSKRKTALDYAEYVMDEKILDILRKRSITKLAASEDELANQKRELKPLYRETPGLRASWVS
eukprot:1329495-Amorphochlora_amoeboformis.AAC.1